MMKKSFFVAVLTILVAVTFIVGLTACGDSSDGKELTSSDGLEFSLEGNVYKLTGLGDCKDSEVVIPSEHDGKAVAYACGCACFGRETLESVVSPGLVTSTGERAFFGR